MTHANPGQIELVAVSRNGGSLWLLDPGARDAPVDFVGLAEDAWRLAARAVPRSIPLLARPYAELARSVPRARHLASHVERGHVIPEQVLDDVSFGLSFALSLASSASGLRLPRDFVATAAVDAMGRTAAVQGLVTKALCLRAKACHVTQLLVAPGHEESELAVAAAAGLTVHEVGSIRAAIDLVLPGIGAELARLAADPASRERLVETLFRLAVDAPNQGLVSWQAVADAALHIQRGISVAPDDWTSWRLGAAASFALRHTSPQAAPRCPWPPPPELMTDVPPPFRQYTVANLIQHATDCGSPPAAGVLAWAEARRFFPPTRDAHPADLRVLGARARSWAVTGRPQDALREQIDLTEAWLHRTEVAEVSYTLCEWFRLAGALGDDEAFDAAVDAHRRARELGDIGAFGGEAFVSFERARAAALLERRDEAEVLLAAYASDPGNVPGFLTLMAARTLARLARAAGDLAAAAGIRASLAGDPEDVALTGAFIDLDAALEAGDAAAARALVTAIDTLAPQTVGHLRASVGGESSPGEAAYIARFYPY